MNMKQIFSILAIGLSLTLMGGDCGTGGGGGGGGGGPKPPPAPKPQRGVYGFQVIETGGGGHCFFCAVSRAASQKFGTNWDQNQVRQKMAEELDNLNPVDQASFMDRIVATHNDYEQEGVKSLINYLVNSAYQNQTNAEGQPELILSPKGLAAIEAIGVDIELQLASLPQPLAGNDIAIDAGLRQVLAALFPGGFPAKTQALLRLALTGTNGAPPGYKDYASLSHFLEVVRPVFDIDGPGALDNFKNGILLPYKYVVEGDPADASNPPIPKLANGGFDKNGYASAGSAALRATKRAEIKQLLTNSGRYQGQIFQGDLAALELVGPAFDITPYAFQQERGFKLELFEFTDSKGRYKKKLNYPSSFDAHFVPDTRILRSSITFVAYSGSGLGGHWQQYGYIKRPEEGGHFNTSTNSTSIDDVFYVFEVTKATRALYDNYSDELRQFLAPFLEREDCITVAIEADCTPAEGCLAVGTGADFVCMETPSKCSGYNGIKDSKGVKRVKDLCPAATCVFDAASTTCKDKPAA